MRLLLDTHTFIWFVTDSPRLSVIETQLSLNSIELLNINLDHLAVVATLPFHHRDPFDRLLISQAIVEQVPILSTDSYQIRLISYKKGNLCKSLKSSFSLPPAPSKAAVFMISL